MKRYHFVESYMDLKISYHQGHLFIPQLKQNSNVRHLKQKIKDTLNLNIEEQELKFNDKSMADDNNKLCDYGITNGCCITLIIHFKKEHFTINVSMQGMDSFDVDVLAKDTLSEVKKKIQKHCGLCPDEQTLEYFGRILEGDESIWSYGVGDQSMISVIRRLTNGMKITVKTMDGKTVAVEVTKQYKIIDVKKKIREKIGLSPDEQRLIYICRILENDKTVDEYQIHEKSVINVVARLRNGIQIFVKTFDRKAFAFEVTKQYKIIDIKKIIQEKIGLSPDEQILLCNNRLLDDDKSVDDYYILEGSVINVVKRALRTIL